MGDSRFHLKVEFSIYGKDYEWDCSLNYSPGDLDCDARIAEWFGECYRDARAGYEQALYEADSERRQKAEELEERLELERLKAKYDH